MESIKSKKFENFEELELNKQINTHGGVGGTTTRSHLTYETTPLGDGFYSGIDESSDGNAAGAGAAVITKG